MSYYDDMNSKKANQIEQIIANFLVIELQALRLTPTQASLIAQLFLEIVPAGISEQQATIILSQLDKNFFNLLKTGQFEKAKQIILEIPHD